MDKIAIISFLVWGIYITMQEGMIFERLGEWSVSVFGDKWSMPISGCAICMAPWYGTPLYWVIWGNSITEWLVTVIGAMGLNAVLSKLMPDKE